MRCSSRHRSRIQWKASRLQRSHNKAETPQLQSKPARPHCRGAARPESPASRLEPWLLWERRSRDETASWRRPWRFQSSNTTKRKRRSCNRNPCRPLCLGSSAAAKWRASRRESCLLWERRSREQSGAEASRLQRSRKRRGNGSRWTLLECARYSPRRRIALDVANPISLETTSAMYITPANCSSMTSARACGRSGMTSLKPTPDSVLKLR